VKQEDILRFLELRADLFTAIASQLREDGHCKSYEGAFTIRLPNYFDQADDEEPWQITLDCYVIGPNRHYHWNGSTFKDALDACEMDVRAWITEVKDDE